MKSEYKLFAVVAGFLLGAAIVYGFWTQADSPVHRPEWIGVVALLLSFLLCTMCGGYFWFISRRIDLRPEDRADADISEGAGEVGFFSPGSYWPFGLALAASMAGLGLVFWAPWLIGAGMVAVVLATGGLLFEYYTGSRRSAEH
ncbi:cytochrome c oxidase subunit 4 [Planosporangium thailandense]|uniref:Cytochrome c oxidase polypeptide 4 n=1 Tax=Planosporangium thailandense TaxID=765197 RepID=A0ABX0XUK2_9ACTN|nr:cytochrome c oxidase subunit 4 [Planosporangium thailandense]NJC69688.1 cytochrome c oxidase subunit 4 [Planosporangium thailandense]